MNVKQASDIKVGDMIFGNIAYPNTKPVKVLEVRTNPHFGWIGFVTGLSSFDWLGWFNPTDKIPIA